MRCPSCGTEFEPSSGRCPSCGRPLPAAPGAGATLDASAPTGFGTPTGVQPPVSPTARLAGPLEVGQAFGPRYHIIRVLGAGGMGVVYQAWDAELGVAVALKVIRPEVLQDPGSAGEVERRFKRELVLARQVTHKHVVRIHDLGELDGIKYLTMPFVEGENLADVLKRRGRLPVEEALAIARQVASGLAAAHEVGVVHRDLKPENIMITADGGALIMDFGISRSVSGTGTATALGAVMGTLEYMAPEQAQGQAVDHRADIYSFGLVVYDMLAGRQRVARRENPMSEMMSRLTQGPAPLGTLEGAAVPPAFERIITRCLQPAADARYGTTAELVRDLEALAPDGHLLVTSKTAAGSRGAIAALASALAILLVGGGLWVWRGAGRAPAAGTPAEPVTVLIANFENRANEPLFDGLVEQALGVGIEGAAFISAYPRRDALGLVKVVKGTSLDEETARRIALREGISRVVAGTIDAGGGRYKLAVKIVNPSEGKPLLTWDTEAAGKNDMLNAVGRVAAKVRNGLGDRTVDTNQVRDAETFTASSLEAAHEYVDAQELQWAGKYEEAIQHYLKAVEIDPTLGRAYAGLGAVSNSLGRRQEAEQYYLKAIGNLERMTDREKYRTQGGYYLLIRNSEKAREQLEALVRQFPADSSGLANLAVASFLRRDMERALELGRKASAIYPNNVLRRNNVALFAMYAGQFDVAEKEAAGVLEINKDFAKAHLVMAVAQLATGRPAEAEATWLRLQAVSAPGKDFAAHGRADLAIYQGRLADAAAVIEEAIATPTAGRSPSTTARLIATLAEVRELQGRGADAVKLAEEATAKSAEQSVALLAGLVMIRAGRAERGLEIAAEFDKKIDTEARMFGQLLRGEADLKRGEARAAVADFEAAVKLADGWLGRFGLGRAYLAAGAYDLAQTEFLTCEKRRGEATTVMLDDIPTYRFMPPVRYYIGRAQEGLFGAASAADSYKAFIAVKEKGDEQGLVADARRRLK